MMSPLVSILVPAYNAEPWLAETLRSALNQTWRPLEVIVIDDGSTDRTRSIAQSFRDDRLLVVSQANLGAAAARNHAFKLCRGDYIQWLDADDLLAPDKIARQMTAALLHRRPRSLLSSRWGHFYYRQHAATFSPNSLWCDLLPTEWLTRKLGQHVNMTNMAWLVSRELTEAAGPWDPRLTLDDDGEYFCRVVMASTEVRFVTDAVSLYRRSSSNSLSRVGTSLEKLDSMFLSNLMHVTYLLSMEDSERTRAASLAYLQAYLYDYHPLRPDLVARLRDFARSLGGEVHLPPFSWKYRWLEKGIGWGAAKRAQVHWIAGKDSVCRFLDRALWRVGA